MKKSTIAIGAGVALTLGFVGCEISRVNWGFQAINSLKTPADPELKCGFTMPADTNAENRAACTFKANARAAETLGISKELATQIPIRHVIIVMKENRSFDHLFGKLHDQGQPDTEAIPADYTNKDLKGVDVAPFRAPDTCEKYDHGHQSQAMTTSVNGGKMDGFVKNFAETTDTDGHLGISYYEQTDLPFYYWLASTWALSDRHFAPMNSGTFSNRAFFMFGTNAGVVDTGISYPAPSTNSIFRTLMNAGFTWGSYVDEHPFSSTLDWNTQDPGVHSMADFYKDLDNGTLPNVAFVDGIEGVDDDHPPADLQVGEAWLRKIYTHATASPQWNRLAIFWTYDEGGAFADHVTPPKGCLATPSGSPFVDMGERIPLVAISPWAKKHYVSHKVHDHTAILRFVETVFDLPALTARDANSDALMDLFDFSCGRDMTPPASVPEAGTGGCPNGPASPVDP